MSEQDLQNAFMERLRRKSALADELAAKVMEWKRETSNRIRVEIWQEIVASAARIQEVK